MATPLKVLRLLNRSVINLHSKSKNVLPCLVKRHILSSSYNCTEAWNKYMRDSSSSELSLSELAVQIHEQLIKTGKASRVDMHVLTHQFSRLDGDEEEAEFMEEILARYNRCQESFPVDTSMSHAIVRCYLQAGLADRLVNLLSDRLTYGLLPNIYTLNLLMNTFINKKKYSSAAKIAYCSTMQEDFSNHVNSLLALESVMQHLTESNLDELAAPKVEAPDEEEEEEWIKVKYIQYPFYDDHFNIKDGRFLLGKTLMMLSTAQSLDLPSILNTSLNLIGAGLYHKFDQGLTQLADLSKSSDVKISQVALDYFSESLNRIESRDTDEPEVEIALRTIDDEIHRMLPTHDEKQEFQAKFGKIKEDLASQGKIEVDMNLQSDVHEFVLSNLKKYESVDVESQLLAFDSWAREREAEKEKQAYEFRKATRIEEMKKQLQELQEKEELLSYFDMEEDIRLKFMEDEEKSDPQLTITRL